MGGKALPEDEGEGGEAEGSGGGSGGFNAGLGAGEERAVGAALGLVLYGVLFCHAEAGGEDAGEGQEEAADEGAVVFGDEAREHGDEAAEDEAPEVFGWSAFAEFGDIDSDAHEGLLSQPESPEDDGDASPDGSQGAGGGEAAGTITHDHEADGAGVDEEGESANDHRTRFEADIGGALLLHGEADGGEGDGGSCREDAAETLRLEDIADDGESGDDETTDEEPSQQVEHGQAFFLAVAMRSSAVVSLLDASGLYCLPMIVLCNRVRMGA